MKQIFRDINKQHRFDQWGYLVQPCISRDQVGQLVELFNETHPTKSEGFYSSSFSQNEDVLNRVNTGIVSIVRPLIEKEFTNFSVLGGSFLVKNPGSAGHMPIHQDWTIVDESSTYSMTIWIPLTQVTDYNGAIRVLPASQQYSSTPRGPTLPDVFASVGGEIERNLITLNMKAGDGFIFNHALIHSSHINQSSQPRVAVAIGLIPRGSNMYFYHRQGNDEVEKFSVPEDFFMRYKNIGERPEIGKSLGWVNTEFNPITKKKLQDMISKHNKEMKTMNSETQILIDTEAQDQLDKEGYTTIPLLSESEVEALFNYYQGLNMKPEGDYGFHISLDYKDSQRKTDITNHIIETLSPSVNKQFQNHQIFTGSYVIKEPGLNNIVPPHQDWTFVDESQYASYTVWIALMDMTLDNGAMCAIPGSQNFFEYPRVSPSPQSKSPLTDYYFTIFSYAKLLEMKAGEALIFNNQTIHASPPNTRATARVAVGIGVTHQDAQLKHFYELPGTSPPLIREYNVDRSFFLQHNNKSLGVLYDNGMEPEGLSVVQTIKRETPELSDEIFKKMIEAVPGNKKNDRLVEKLAGLYEYRTDGTKKTASETNVDEADETHSPIDNRSFFQKYTVRNIIAEINHRFKHKA